MDINAPQPNPEPLESVLPKGPGETVPVNIDLSALRMEAKAAGNVGERPLDAVQYANPAMKFNQIATQLKEAANRGDTTASLLNDVATSYPQLRSALPSDAKVSAVKPLVDSTGAERISVQYSMPGDADAGYRSIDITKAGTFIKVNHPGSQPLTN